MSVNSGMTNSTDKESIPLDDPESMKGMFMSGNTGVTNATDKEPIHLPAERFMSVNTGMINATDKEPIPLQTAESKMEFGTTTNS